MPPKPAPPTAPVPADDRPLPKELAAPADPRDPLAPAAAPRPAPRPPPAAPSTAPLIGSPPIRAEEPPPTAAPINIASPTPVPINYPLHRHRYCSYVTRS